MKSIRILLSAVSLLMLLGCSDGIDAASMTKIFNVTCDSIENYPNGDPPNGNVIFPPALNRQFYVFKGIVKDGQIDCAEKTTVYRHHLLPSSSYPYNYGVQKNCLALDSFYTYKSDPTYLSPDDDEKYALLIRSHGQPDGNIQSDFFYPKDLIAIKCKNFTRTLSDRKYYKYDYSWMIEFSGEQPDSLYFMQFKYGQWSVTKAYYKLYKLSSSYINYYEKIDLDSTNFIHNTSTDSYIAIGSHPGGGGYTAIFAEYGDYYVRVTPRM